MINRQEVIGEGKISKEREVQRWCTILALAALLCTITTEYATVRGGVQITKRKQLNI